MSASPFWARCELCDAHADVGCDCATCADCGETYGYQASRTGLCRACDAKVTAMDEAFEAALEASVRDLERLGRFVTRDEILARAGGMR